MWELQKCVDGVITKTEYPDAATANVDVQALEKQGYQYVDKLHEKANMCYEIKFRRDKDASRGTAESGDNHQEDEE